MLISILVPLFFLFRSFVNQETYNQYRNCYNDVTDFMTILRGQYIDIIRSFNVREPVYEITEQSQYRIPYSGTERRKAGMALTSCLPVRPEY